MILFVLGCISSVLSIVSYFFGFGAEWAVTTICSCVFFAGHHVVLKIGELGRARSGSHANKELG